MVIHSYSLCTTTPGAVMVDTLVPEQTHRSIIVLSSLLFITKPHDGTTTTQDQRPNWMQQLLVPIFKATRRPDQTQQLSQYANRYNMILYY